MFSSVLIYDCIRQRLLLATIFLKRTNFLPQKSYRIDVDTLVLQDEASLSAKRFLLATDTVSGANLSSVASFAALKVETGLTKFTRSPVFTEACLSSNDWSQWFHIESLKYIWK